MSISEAGNIEKCAEGGEDGEGEIRRL